MDVSKFRERRVEESSSRERPARPDMFKVSAPGTWIVYICPPSAAMGDYPCVEVDLHYGIGPERKMVACIARDSFVFTDAAQNALAARNERNIENGKPEWAVELDPEEGCPVCAAFEEGDDERRKQSWLFNVIPIAFIDPKGRRTEVAEHERVIRPWFASFKQREIVFDAISDAGDITDPDAATYVRITRVGTEFKSTRYSGGPDVETLRTPVRIPKPMRAAVRAIESGENDLLGLATAFVRSFDTLADMVGSASSEAEESTSATPPSCFEKEHDAKDATCVKCPFKGPCATACDKSSTMAEMKPAPRAKTEPETKPATRASTPASRVVGPSRVVGRTAAPEKKPEPVVEDDPPFEADAEKVDDEDEAEIDELQKMLIARAKKKAGK
jgi:hypothetical protein